MLITYPNALGYKSDQILASSSLVTLNQWYHIAMVYDGSNLKGYLNGVLQGSLSYTREIPTSAQNYAIGAPETTNMGAGGYGGFNLAQFKLYQLPLTDSDILQEYNLRKNELDYTIHSPATNSNPTYWNISSAWNNSTGSYGAYDAFSVAHYTPWLNSTLGWAAQTLDANQWITLNYDVPTYIKGVVIQPRANSGNQFVTIAKQFASQNGVAIDMPAGPSELLVYADETAIPSFVASDLLSQAEHGKDSQVILVTTNKNVLNDVIEFPFNFI